jgi:hypothetical protein
LQSRFTLLPSNFSRQIFFFQNTKEKFGGKNNNNEFYFAGPNNNFLDFIKTKTFQKVISFRESTKNS